MTWEELMESVDNWDCAGMVDEPAVKALRAVVELHNPINMGEACDCCEGPSSCDVCGEFYPCPTIQAIEKELSNG